MEERAHAEEGGDAETVDRRRQRGAASRRDEKKDGEGRQREEEGVEVQETVEPESLTLTTSRVGHPLLVKISFHARWRAEGADGPYLVSPALMLVVPRQPTVRLVYARNWADRLGLALSVATVLFALAHWAWAARRPAPARVPVLLPDACDLDAPPRRWGWIVPAATLAMLLGLRLLARG